MTKLLEQLTSVIECQYCHDHVLCLMASWKFYLKHLDLKPFLNRIHFSLVLVMHLGIQMFLMFVVGVPGCFSPSLRSTH